MTIKLPTFAASRGTNRSATAVSLLAMGAFVLFLIGRFVYDSRKAKIDA